MADSFLQFLKQRYPKGNEQLERLFKDFNEKLNNSEFSDCDEEALVRAADTSESLYHRKRKSNETIPQREKKALYQCDLCDAEFTKTCNLSLHMITHTRKRYECNTCSKTLSCLENLKRHEKMCIRASKSHKKQRQFPCRHCGLPFDTYEDLFDYINVEHPLNQTGGQAGQVVDQMRSITNSSPPLSSDPSISTLNPQIENINHLPTEKKKNRRVKKSALNDSINQIEIIPEGSEKYDLLQFFSNVKEDIQQIVESRKKYMRDIKWYLNVKVEMERDIQDGQTETVIPSFRSRNYVSLFNDNDLEHNLNEAYQKMHRSLEEYINRGSNWIIRKVVHLEARTVKYAPINGSSYMQLPSAIKLCKGVINIQNDDNKCFLWSVLAAIHPTDNNAHRVHKYKPFENELNTTGLDFPVPIKQVEKIEKLNNLSINVFGYEGEQIFPLALSKSGNVHQSIDLLYISNEKQSHYCLIKNLNRFLRQTNQHNAHFFCRRCLHGFSREDLLVSYQPYCDQIDFQKVQYPKEGENILEFNDFYKGIKISFTIIADFECFSRKMDTSLPNPKKSSITSETKFEPSGYSYIVLCTNDDYSKPPVVYRGDNVIEHFFEDMATEEEYINDILGEPEPLIMNDEAEQEFQLTTNCEVCQTLFDENVIKVRDHAHHGITRDPRKKDYTNYRHALCQRCNLSLKEPSYIPVLFHNGKNFDTHLLLQKADCFKDKPISCIPNNMEKYVSLTIGNLRFLDTCQFLNSSLDTLVKNLSQEGPTHFRQFKKAFPSEDIAKLLLRKNEYCYDYVDCEERFQERQLPSKEAFHNRLTDEPISDQDYNHALEVWNTMNMNTLGDFHDLYVMTDVLLLADVFERFRDITMENYGLDPCHFFTAPGLAWQAALKMSGVSLELITDPIIYNLVELGTRGGIASINQKYAKANNKYMKDFDPSKPSSHILYTDCGNLYGAAMMQPLPTGMFRLLKDDEIRQFNINEIEKDASTGYILEVDLEYPPELHDHHNCYPLAPSHKKVKMEELSPYSQNLWKDLNGENASKVVTKKLIPTLENKDHYILHYRNLQLYLELGMKVTKIHQIVEFHQSRWLKTYIDFNSQKRKEANNVFEKEFYKLMNNSVFGKTMEDIRRHRNVKLMTDQKKLVKYTSKPSFDHFQIFNQHLVGIENKKVNILLNKPIYVGQAILDISKALMYEFHYKTMKPMYGEDIRLLFTDTDSLCYEIMTDDVYKDMEIIKDHFDFSGYPQTHYLFSNKYKKMPGKFKDELDGVPIKEFVGLRPKMYSLIYDDGNTEQEKKTAKGIKKCAVKKQLKHANYKECLFQNVSTMNSMKLIKSQNHELFVNHIVKKGLSNFDEKRFWINHIKSYAYGHFKI